MMHLRSKAENHQQRVEEEEGKEEKGVYTPITRALS